MRLVFLRSQADNENDFAVDVDPGLMGVMTVDAPL